MSQGRHWQVRYQHPVEYEIRSSEQLFAPENPSLLSCGRIQGGRRFVVVDDKVHALHGQAIQAYFAAHGVDCRVLVFPGGEENKTLAQYTRVLQALDEFPVHRRDEPVIAIGGGVLTDVVSFVASTWRRGVPHLRVPTTLMCYVDAAVGVKTGINFNGHKNRVGSFAAPQQVLLDRGLMQSLPLRHLHNGMCEIIKLAVICDAPLFELLEQQGRQSIDARLQNDAAEPILERAISSMIAELQPNLFEADLARKVDFGHTFSYGLEAHYDQHLLHGEAVLLDILISVVLAGHRQLLGNAQMTRIFALLGKLGMQFDAHLLDTELIAQTLQDRIAHRNGQQNIPVPTDIGQGIFLNDVTQAEIRDAVKYVKNYVHPEHELLHEC